MKSDKILNFFSDIKQLVYLIGSKISSDKDLLFLKKKKKICNVIQIHVSNPNGTTTNTDNVL